MTIVDGTQTPVFDIEMTRRALRLALGKTTDMAKDVLRVPLHYCRDPKLTDVEESQILRQTPWPSSRAVKSRAERLSSAIRAGRFVAGHPRQGWHEPCVPQLLPTPRRDAGLRIRYRVTFHLPLSRVDIPEHGELATVPGKAGFSGMDYSGYGLVELPNQESHGFIWAVLSADGSIDVEEHLGDLGPELARIDYGSYSYHDQREFESEVSWKGALEAFAEGYHFPFVHGQSVIGQSTLANTTIYDEYGKHHRLGFPFKWITNLDVDPNASWNVQENMAVIYWIYPNLILADGNVGVEVIDILPAGSPTRCTVRHSWMARQAATSAEHRGGYDLIFNSVHAAVRDEDFAMLPQCGEGVRHGQHDHMIIGRNEIGVQHMIKTFAEQLGIALS